MFYFQTWGEAYGQNKTQYPPAYAYTSFATLEHEIVVDGHLATHPFTTKFLNMQPTTSFIGTKWRNAQEHSFFYIGIYATIGLGGAFVNVSSFLVQFTGALRASRILFQRLLITVVRATMRWHDVTPQGKITYSAVLLELSTLFTGRMLNRFGKVRNAWIGKTQCSYS